MMGKITDLINQLKASTEEAQEQALLRIMIANQSYILDLETLRLFKGLDSNGEPIKPPYASEAYAQFKRSLNPAGVVDLKLTGAFYQGFFMTADSFPITFDSTDSKTPVLTEKYDHIFGEDSASLTEIQEQILSQVRDHYRTQVYQV